MLMTGIFSIVVVLLTWFVFYSAYADVRYAGKPRVTKWYKVFWFLLKLVSVSVVAFFHPYIMVCLCFAGIRVVELQLYVNYRKTKGNRPIDLYAAIPIWSIGLIISVINIDI